MAQPIRLLLLIPHLGGGGAEQVTALLARGLSAEKYEIHLGLITQAEGEHPVLPRRVTVHALGARRVRAGAPALLRLVRGLQPDVILSGMAHLNFLVLLMRPLLPRKTRIMVRQNATVSSVLQAGSQPRYAHLLYKHLYRRADTVICQSRAMAEDLAAVTGMPLERIAIAPNPVDFENIRAAQAAPASWEGPGPHLLAVGRLAPEKGFDLLIEAFALVRRRFPTADLVIAGKGSEESALKCLCRALEVEQAVRFPGQVDCPYAFYRGASLFVLPSRQEGMPNALLEALSAGLPLVATPASGGIVDLLSRCPGAWQAREISAAALAEAMVEALITLQPGQRFRRDFAESGHKAQEAAASQETEGLTSLNRSIGK